MGITARLTVPATTRIIKSIVYSFPLEVTGEEQLLSQEIVEKTEEVIGMRPLLPQPTLVHAPHNVLLSLPKEKIIPQILEQVQKMAPEVYGKDLLRHSVPCWNQPINHACHQEGQGRFPSNPPSHQGCLLHHPQHQVPNRGADGGACKDDQVCQR